MRRPGNSTIETRSHGMGRSSTTAPRGIDHDFGDRVAAQQDRGDAPLDPVGPGQERRRTTIDQALQGMAWHLDVRIALPVIDQGGQ